MADLICSESKYLVVKESWLSNSRPTNAFATKIATIAAAATTSTTATTSSIMGLFANTEFKQGEVVCVYRGRSLATAEALRLPDKSYLMRLGEQCYVDAKDDESVLARYINDCINPAGHNVRFDKQPLQRAALVVASRDVACGEELFADYGKRYWAGSNITPTRLAFMQLHLLKSSLCEAVPL